MIGFCYFAGSQCEAERLFAPFVLLARIHLQTDVQGDDDLRGALYTAQLNLQIHSQRSGQKVRKTQSLE